VQKVKNTLRVERAKLQISQDELATRVCVSRQTINSIEKGKKLPSIMLALQIAEIFDIPVNSLFQLNKS